MARGVVIGILAHQACTDSFFQERLGLIPSKDSGIVTKALAWPR